MKTILRSVIFSAALACATLVSAVGINNYAENKMVDALMRGQAIGAPATWYVGLDTGACTETGSGTEVTGGSYTRVAVAASLAAWAGTQSAGSTTASSGTNGTTSNNATITFPAPTADWGSVQSFRVWDAPTSGNAWFCQTLTIPKTINNGDAAPAFSAGSLTIQVDN